MSLEIRLANGQLDLLPNTEDEFYVTKQLHDLAELNTRKGDFTKQITLPYTANNIILLEEDIPSRTRHEDRGTRYINCEVIMDGTPVIDDPYLRIDRGDQNGFAISIYSGNVNFFNQLKSNGINELVWVEYDGFEWNLANLIGQMDNSDGIVFANSFWYSNESLRSYILNDEGNPAADLITRMDINASGFFVYCRTILDKIFEQLDGLTVNFDTLNPNRGTLLNEVAIAANMTAIQESYNTGDGYSGTSAALQENIVPQANVIFPLAPLAQSGVLMTNSQWVIQTDGVATCIISGNYRYSFVGPIKRATMSVMKNNTVIRNLTLRYQQNNAVFFYEGDHPAVVGDLFWLRLSVTGTTGSIALFEVNALFAINKGGSSVSSNIVNLRDYIPDFSQKEFVRAMFNMFHIVPKERAGVVNLYYWDDIPTSEAIESDYEESRDYEESGLLAGYARNNFMRYTPHPSVQRNNDQSITVDVATEDVERDLIVLPFTAVDQSEIQDTATVGSLPFYNLTKVSYASAISWVSTVFTTIDSHNLQVGDIIRNVQGQRAKVLLITNNLSGTTDVSISGSASWYRLRMEPSPAANMPIAHMIQRAGAVQIQDGANAATSSTPNYRRGVFSDAQFWPTLINNFYRNFANSIRSPYVVSVYVDLDTQTFAEMDQLRPLYIKSLAAKFYVNKIEQFKGRGFVRMELVQVGASNEIPSTILDLQGAYDSAFSNDFNNFPENTPSN